MEGQGSYQTFPQLKKARWFGIRSSEHSLWLSPIYSQEGKVLAKNAWLSTLKISGEASTLSNIFDSHIKDWVLWPKLVIFWLIPKCFQ
jgi:hypothetical protein